jgi:hypothetical protein
VSSLTLGKAPNGRPVTLSPKVRTTHMQVIGASGTGKTKFLENMIRQDILQNQGLCLIDPTGNLYLDLVRWCETKGFLGRKKILLFDPSSHEWTFGFNPLHFGEVLDEDLSFFVDSMVKACAQVWGGEDTDKTPLLKRCLRMTFHALAEKRLTLLEGLTLANELDAHGLRKYLTAGLKDPVMRDQWEAFNALKPREFREQFGSTVNRLMEFLASERLRRILGQQEKLIDFRRIMDEGHILLVSLSSGKKISEDNASLLGALLVNDLFLKARGRPKGSRPFYLYIDECARFINEDIGRMLDEGRQFGLHLILAHQHLSQLRRAGEWICQAVMTDARTKVVFGGLSPEDAETMAEAVFMGELDLEEAKESLIKPTLVGHEIGWFESRSESQNWSDGESSGTSESWGSQSGTSHTRTYREEFFFGEMFSFDEELSQSDGWSQGTSHSSGRSTSRSSSRGRSSSYGESQGLIPVLKNRPTTVFSLEEQLYKATAMLRNLRQRHAVVKIPELASIAMTAAPIEEGCARAERVARFQAENFRQSPFASPVAEVEARLRARQERLLAEAQESRAEAVPEAPDDFLE